MANPHNNSAHDDLFPDQTNVKNYFDRLRSQVRGMPAEAREDRLQELRYHLLSLIATHRAAGRREEDAVAEALAQMGDATQLGRTLMRQ